MTVKISQLKEEWADREAIRDCLSRYARGIDRIDADMLRSAYWPDAKDEHGGLFSGTIEELVEQSINNLPSIDTTVHMLGNSIIRIDGDKAAAESYVYAIHRQVIDGVMRDILTSARYLDRFERRDDEWRIAERRVVIDWFREFPDSGDWKIGPFGTGDGARGGRQPNDESYAWLGLR